MAKQNGDYNGWSSFETYTIALWLDNERSSYEYWRQIAKELRTQARHEEKDWDPVTAMAHQLKDEIEDNRPTEFLNADGMNHGASGMYSDLLGAALSEVNWYELAKSRFEE